MCHVCNEKQKTTNDVGIELPNQEKIRALGEKETYKYLGILEAFTNKKAEMKKKIKKEYLRITRKLVKTKLHNRNLIKGIDCWAFPLSKILENIFKVDERSSKNELEIKKTHDDA